MVENGGPKKRKNLIKRRKEKIGEKRFRAKSIKSVEFLKKICIFSGIKVSATQSAALIKVKKYLESEVAF